MNNLFSQPSTIIIIPTKQKAMEDKFDNFIFREKFANFCHELEIVKKSMRSEKGDFFASFSTHIKTNFQRLYPILQAEAYKLMEEEWKSLESRVNFFVAFHSATVVCLVYLDESFDFLPQNEQNILLWASLLHDVKKRAFPQVVGKDHIHPFSSAANALLFFRKHDLIAAPLLQVQSLADKICQCVKKIETNTKNKTNTNTKTETSIKTQTKTDAQKQESTTSSYCDEIQDHEKLANLLPEVKAACGGPFSAAYQIFSLICFHQSVHVLKKYPHQSVLDLQLIGEFFSEGSFRLFGFLMLHDSISYTYESSETSQKNRKEILETLAKVREKIFGKPTN